MGRHFPYYDGQPTALSPVGWLIVLAATAAGFAALIGLPVLAPGWPAVWAGTALFVALPLLGLRVAVGPAWTALFHRPTARDVWIGLGCALLCMAVSATVAIVVMKTGVTNANPAVAALAKASPLDIALFYVQTGTQLLGEELVTVIPFLAVLTLATALKASRPAAIALAWITSAVLFGLLHLPTYGWNVVQAVTVIGSARLALTLAYVATRNIWASTIAHIVNDWTLFTLALVLFAVQRR